MHHFQQSCVFAAWRGWRVAADAAKDTRQKVNRSVQRLRQNNLAAAWNMWKAETLEGPPRRDRAAKALAKMAHSYQVTPAGLEVARNTMLYCVFLT